MESGYLALQMSRIRKLERRRVWLAFGYAFLTGLSLCLLIMRGSFPSPFLDEFYFHELYKSAAAGNFDLEQILTPHFGHNYALLKSWFWLVVNLQFDWRISMFIGAAILAACAGLTAYFILRDTWSRFNVMAATAAAFAVVSARQYENLYWAMQISVAVLLLSTVLAFAAVEKFEQSQNARFAFYACGLSLIAFLCNGAGTFTLLLSLSAIWVLQRRQRKVQAAVWCTFAAWLALLGVGHFLGQMSSSESDSMLTPGNLVTFVLAFFANALFSFSSRGDDIFSLAIGAAVLFSVAIIAWRAREIWREQTLPLLLIAFGSICSVAIGVARLEGGIFQPNAPRYYSFAITFVIGSLIALARINRRNPYTTFAAVFLIAGVVVSAMWAYVQEWGAAPYRHSAMESAHVNLCSGHSDGLAFGGTIGASGLHTLGEVFCARNPSTVEGEVATLMLIEFGPRKTSAGTVFNLQPDGHSAIWASVANATASTVMTFEGERLDSVVNKEGTLVTATVPPRLYKRPGEYAIALEDTTNGRRSNKLIFLVQETLK